MASKKSYKYGIELETLVPYNEYDRLNDKLALSGLKINRTGDGSIETGYSESNGVEFRTTGAMGSIQLTRTIKALSRLLNSHGVTVNKSCGFHVHISNKRFYNARNLKRLVFIG